MVFLDLVKKNNSCRKYSDKFVSRDSLERCLEAARLAPSACNSQPWKFIIIHNKDLKDKVANAAFSGIYSMNMFACDAQALVLVIREDSKTAVKAAQMIQGTQFNLLDIGIACQHFILQAAEEGLGTCWLGWFNAKAAKKVLNIPKGKKLEIIISLGYPQEDNVKEKSRKSLEEMSEIIE